MAKWDGREHESINGKADANDEHDEPDENYEHYENVENQEQSDIQKKQK